VGGDVNNNTGRIVVLSSLDFELPRDDPPKVNELDLSFGEGSPVRQDEARDH
jgi:hypothetical protein